MATVATDARFERFAGTCALLVAAVGVIYAIVFFVSRETTREWVTGVSEALLMLGGLLTIPVFVAVYERLRPVEPAFALLALVLGLAGALGTAIHGAYDLSRIINPPQINPDVPNPVDPRGFAAFGIAGLALLVLGWLLGRVDDFPERLGQLAYVTGILLLLVFLARLTVLDETHPLVLIPAILAAAASALLYLWLGTFLRGRRAGPRRQKATRIEA